MNRSSSTRRVSALVSVLAAAGLLAACSSSSTDGSAEAAGSAATSAAAGASSSAAGGAGSTSASSSSSGDTPTDLPSLALTAADFPAGYELQEVTTEQLQAADGGSALSGATVTPTECKDAVEANSNIDYSQAGVAVAVEKTQGAVLTASVSPLVTSPADLRAQVSACATLSISSATLGEATGTLTEVDAPDVGADDVVGVESTIKASAGGQSGTITTTAYTAEVRGVQVSVAAVSLTGGEIDTTVVTDLLRTAVTKVANA